MIVPFDGSKLAQLGVQTSPGNVEHRAHWLAGRWAPSRAQSYDLAFFHTDYEGYAEDHETGYARVNIQYFSTKAEGQYLIDECPEDFQPKPGEVLRYLGSRIA